MDLEPGENRIFEGHPSWRATLGFYIKGLLVAALAGGIAALASKAFVDEFEPSWIVAAVLAVVLLGVIAGWIKRSATHYVITDRRLYLRKGIFARKEQQTHLARVQSVSTSQSVLQRLLRVGDVDFETAADEAEDFRFEGVSSPQRVVAAVHRAQRSGDPV